MLKLLLTLAVLFSTPVLAPPAGAAATSPEHAGSPYRLLQMNLCLSGLAGCFGGTEYPKVVDEAIAQIDTIDPHAVTLNEACSGDVERIAAETGYHLRFATVIYNGAPLPCRNPGDRGVFGNAVLTKERIRESAEAAFESQFGSEERRWLCATTTRDVTACVTHLSTRGSDGARAANDGQCAELAQVLAGYAASGPTIFGGDVNRTDSCAAAGMWTLTDAEAEQAPGIQHLYGSAEFRGPRVEVVPATYTDHDFAVAQARLLPPGLR